MNAVAPDDTAVPVGDVTGAHALRGLLRVRAYQPDSPNLAPGRTLLVEHHGTWREARVTSASAHGRVVLLGLDGVGDRTAAEALRGARLLVRHADLPPTEPDEFYDFEVQGWVVETVDGRTLGTVAQTIDNGLHGVWSVRDDADHEVLIPVIDDVVRLIDRHGRRIVVDPLPGLLD